MNLAPVVKYSLFTTRVAGNVGGSYWYVFIVYILFPLLWKRRHYYFHLMYFIEHVD